MTHVCCPSCRLRFTAAAAAHFDACPTCGEPAQRTSAAGAFGFRLVAVAEIVGGSPTSAAIAVPVGDPDLTRF